MIKDNNSSEIFSAIIPIFIIVLLILSWLYNKFFQEKKYKSEVAEDYGISKYTLSRWIELFCPQKVSEKYVGDKTQTIILKDITFQLGMPFKIPVYLKGGREKRKIISKEDLLNAYIISDSTLRRKIKVIENPIKTIGMSLKTYSSLKSFPPSKMNLICDYLESLGYNRKKEALSQINHQYLDLFAETVGYTELAGIK